MLQGLDPGYAFSCRRPDGSVVEEGMASPPGSDPNQLFLERVCARIGC